MKALGRRTLSTVSEEARVSQCVSFTVFAPEGNNHMEPPHVQVTDLTPGAPSHHPYFGSTSVFLLADSMHPLIRPC